VSRGHRLQACHANGGPLHERWRPPVAAAHAAIEAPGAEWQAVAWIKRREGRQLDGRVRLQGDRDFLKQLELALQYGFPFMVASVDEWLDPVLDPLLEKAVSVQVHARCPTLIVPCPVCRIHSPDTHVHVFIQSVVGCAPGGAVHSTYWAWNNKRRFIYTHFGSIIKPMDSNGLAGAWQGQQESATTRTCQAWPMLCCKPLSSSRATSSL